MNLESITPQKLADAVNAGYEALQWLRDRRKRAFEAYLGPDFGQGDEVRLPRRVWQGSPLNLTAQQVRTLLPYLAMHNPKADVVAKQHELEWDADMHRQSADLDAADLDLSSKYQQAAVDAILGGMAIHKIGLRASNDVLKLRDREADPGELFEEPVDTDDWCTDADAKRWRQRRWDAYRYTVDRHEAREYRYYGRDPGELEPGEFHHPLLATREEASAMLEALAEARRPGQESGGEGERVSDAAIGSVRPGDEPLIDDVELWDVVLYCNGETYIATIAASRGLTAAEPTDKFLAFYRFDGPTAGPLRYLTLLPTPAQLVPQSLDAMQKDLATVADALANKAIRQAMRTKQNTIFRADQRDEMKAILAAQEDDFVEGDPTAFTTVQQGGLVEDVVIASNFVNDWWNNVTGGLSMAAGQEDKGKGTATAFQGLMNRVMGWTQFLQLRMEMFATECLKMRMFYRLTDPFWAPMLNSRLPNTQTIDVIYDADLRRGGFNDFIWNIKAHSMQVQDPVFRAARLNEALAAGGPVDNILQKGMLGIIDPFRALRDYARLTDLPELELWLVDPVTFQMVQMRAMMAQQQSEGVSTGTGRPAGDAAPGYGARYGQQQQQGMGPGNGMGGAFPPVMGQMQMGGMGGAQPAAMIPGAGGMGMY